MQNSNNDGSQHERIPEHKRARASNLDNHLDKNYLDKKNISQEENRPINSSNISKAKKTKVQQIRSH